MKTKDYELFIHPDVIKEYDDGHSRCMKAYSNMGNERYLKARLIIELPEKSVSITESQMSELCDEYYKSTHQYPTIARFLSEKLFNGKDA